MEGPERLLVFCEVGIEGGGAVEGALGEELGDAVCLRIMSFIDAGDRQTVGREGRWKGRILQPIGQVLLVVGMLS
jgi:hypothetical protein